MLFNLLSAKKTKEQLQQEKEMERAWSLYGQEVEDFLGQGPSNQEFEQLERSKYATRPPMKIQAVHTQLSEDLQLRVQRGEIQPSKAYRFMADPALKALLTEPLSEDLQKQVAQGTIQGSKARRFMTDPVLRAMLFK